MIDLSFLLYLFCFGYFTELIQFLWYRAPFDLAIFLLVIMVASIMFLWDENYGDPTANVTHSFQAANVVIRSGYSLFFRFQLRIRQKF